MESCAGGGAECRRETKRLAIAALFPLLPQSLLSLGCLYPCSFSRFLHTFPPFPAQRAVMDADFEMDLTTKKKTRQRAFKACVLCRLRKVSTIVQSLRIYSRSETPTRIVPVSTHTDLLVRRRTGQVRIREPGRPRRWALRALQGGRPAVPVPTHETRR